MNKNFQKMSEMHLKMLQDDWKRGALVPFVGAGFSCDLNREAGAYPTWEAFLQECAESTLESERIIHLIKDKKLLEAADEIHKIYPPFREVVKYTFGKRLEKYPAHSPVSLLPKLFPDSLVITTNFDFVLSDVYGRSNRAFEDVDCNLSNYVVLDAVRENRHYLLQLHGKASDMESLILTKSQYNRVYGEGKVDFNNPLPKAIRKLLESKKLLFLGCSLCAEDRFTEILQRCHSENDAVTHYAIIECRENDSTTEAMAARLIQNYGIMPIWFPEKQYGKIYEYLAALSPEKAASKGLLQLKSKQYESALKIFEDEIDALSKDSEVYYYAAIALFRGQAPFFAKLSTVKKAISYLERALDLIPQAKYYYVVAFICKNYYEEHGLKGVYHSAELFEKARRGGITEDEVSEINQYFHLTSC